MKNTLKLLSTTMVVAISISTYGINNVYADQNEEVIAGDNPIVIDDFLIEAQGVDIPTNTVTLSSIGSKMTFSGSSSWSDLYSSNLFTGASQIEYRFDNRLNKKLTVTLYKKGSLSKVSTITVPANSAAGGIINLTSSSKYYFKFSGGNDNGTDFYGYIIRKK